MTCTIRLVCVDKKTYIAKAARDVYRKIYL
jgi:hypothetical protein